MSISQKLSAWRATTKKPNPLKTEMVRELRGFVERGRATIDDRVYTPEFGGQLAQDITVAALKRGLCAGLAPDREHKRFFVGDLLDGFTVNAADGREIAIMIAVDCEANTDLTNIHTHTVTGIKGAKLFQMFEIIIIDSLEKKLWHPNDAERALFEACPYDPLDVFVADKAVAERVRTMAVEDTGRTDIPPVFGTSAAIFFSPYPHLEVMNMIKVLGEDASKGFLRRLGIGSAMQLSDVQEELIRGIAYERYMTALKQAFGPGSGVDETYGMGQAMQIIEKVADIKCRAAG